MKTRQFRAFGALLMATAAAQASASDFTIAPTFDGSFFRWNVQIGTASAEINPPLYLARGQSYSFTVNTSGSHPFYFKTVNSAGSLNGYSDGVSVALPVTTGSPFTFDPPQDAPDTLFYNCGVHGTMNGTINVVVFRSGFD